MARALQLKLNGSGFDAQVANDGEEALAALQQGGYALLLLDLMMPKVDGFAVLEGMKQRGDTTPVIVSTNLSQEQDIQKAKEMGARDYFVKSDTPLNAVIDHVKQTLAQFQ